MKRAALISTILLGLALCAALDPPASPAAPSADEIRERRLIHGETSVLGQAAALPYRVVALAGWPLGRLLDWMEATNFPARVGDFVFYPVHHLRKPPGDS